MKLKAAINGAIYDIIEGATFAEEWSETLDSGSIIIDKVPKFDLRPYDDVFIFDADEDEYVGWGKHGDAGQAYIFSYGADYVIRTENTNVGVASPDPLNPYVSTDAIRLRKSAIDGFFNGNYSVTAYIRCRAFYYEDQYGWTADQWGFGATYALTKSGDEITFTRMVNSSDTGTPPSAMVFVLDPDGYYVMGDKATTGQEAILFDGLLIFEGRADLLTPIAAPVYDGFHKHMLVDQYEATCINITNQTYKYKIDLFSETKKLEKVILPNIALTQPIPLAKRKSVWRFLNIYLSQYSPQVKVGANGIWSYVQKYTLDPSLESLFDSVYAPEMQMNQPTLRDVLTQLMLTKDMIPYVEDDVIKGMDLSSTRGTFAYSADDTTAIVTSMSSSNYSNGLKRQFDNALAQTKTCKRVEYLGFRNSDQGLLTLDNLRLEFSYPIYKIDKMYMCYWKKIDIVDQNGDPVNGSDGNPMYRYFLCKQDITPLILQNQKRNILSQDWTTMPNVIQNLTTEEMASYRFYTVGYDIGSREITGWAEKYQFPDSTAIGNGWWTDATKSYLENIVSIMDRKYGYGIYADGWENAEAELPVGTHGIPRQIDITTPSTFPRSPYAEEGYSLWLKGLVFQVEYQAFYSGATYADKDDDRDDIISPDNPSSSLTVLEKDGIFQEAKANRFGNEATMINCRYADPSGMQPLASEFQGDSIVFRREYAIYRNVTQCSYSATKGYVLKNYFTSVFAQLRPFPLAGYDQSVNKAETDRAYITFSKTRKTVDRRKANITFKQALSPFMETQVPASVNDIKNPLAINYQTIRKGSYEYASDVNCFVNGHSLCISFQMRDNLGMGNYIRKATPFGSFLSDLNPNEDPDEWMLGSEQDWWPIIDDVETGEIDGSVAFVAKNVEDSKQITTTYGTSGNIRAADNEVDSIYNNEYFKLPRASTGVDKLSLSKRIWKDQKETLNQTIQYEYQADEGIAISEMLPTLNDMLGAKRKWAEDHTVTNPYYKAITIRTCAVTMTWPRFTNPTAPMQPELIIGIQASQNLSDITAGQKIRFGESVAASWATNISKLEFALGSINTSEFQASYAGTSYASLSVGDVEIVSVSESQLVIEASISVQIWINNIIVKTETQASRRQITLERRNPEPTGWRYYTTGNGTQYGDSIFGFHTILTDPPNRPSIDEAFIHTYTAASDIPYTESGIYTVSGVSDTLHKNQFVVYSPNKVKKENAYDELASISASNDKVTDVFAIADDQITVDLGNAPEGTQSVQYWYLDQDSGAYRFVFGVDVTAEELDEGFATVYASITDTKDPRVFDSRMNQIGSVSNAAENIEWNEGRHYN